ncbi:MAG: DMT family transporter [Proteobacteria bacterium]|nr:DMT family transporter [Pseudomonadota bacterium]
MLPPGTLRGIVSMLAACAAFACMDALLKILSGTFPPAQVAALRGLTGLPLVCLYVAWRGELRTLFSRELRWGLHAVRGVLTLLMLLMFTFGLKSLGLAEAYTLTFVAPLIITLLSVPLLGERVRPRHWMTIAAGFTGVLVALRPEQGAFMSVGALAILAAAVCYALSNVLGRLVSRSEPSSTLVFWTTAGLTVGGAALAAPQWVPLAPEHAWPLAGLALSGFLGQLAISEAFRHGQAAAIAPFEYSALAWGIALDWLIWRAVPDAWTLGGGAIIIASGLYLARSETRGRAAASPTQPA